MKIFHHNDADGRCAGAIAWRSKLVNRSPDCEVIEIDYKDLETGEYDLSKIQPNEKLIIVDFSFKPPLMNKILKITKDILWFDHHLTSLEYKYDVDLPGTRDKNFSGCELAWNYFYPDYFPPAAVEYIGDRDRWVFKYGDTSTKFTQGLKLHPHEPKDIIWDLILGSAAGLNISPREEVAVNKIIDEGRTCIAYRDSFCRDYIKSFGFETKFEGYKAFALGLMMMGSDAFGDKRKEYDLLLAFEFDGESYTVGVYSDNIDVSKICQKYAGGGHKGAGGFIIKDLPFRRIR